jgi:hypothetical protein
MSFISLRFPLSYMQIRLSREIVFSLNHKTINYFRRPEGGGGGGGEDGMPLVETVSPGNGSVCRAGSCTEDPQVHIVLHFLILKAAQDPGEKFIRKFFSILGHENPGFGWDPDLDRFSA